MPSYSTSGLEDTMLHILYARPMFRLQNSTVRIENKKGKNPWHVGPLTAIHDTKSIFVHLNTQKAKKQCL